MMITGRVSGGMSVSACSRAPTARAALLRNTPYVRKTAEEFGDEGRYRKGYGSYGPRAAEMLT